MPTEQLKAYKVMRYCALHEPEIDGQIKLQEQKAERTITSVMETRVPEKVLQPGTLPV